MIREQKLTMIAPEMAIRPSTTCTQWQPQFVAFT